MRLYERLTIFRRLGAGVLINFVYKLYLDKFIF